jgi:hypothetical protein
MGDATVDLIAVGRIAQVQIGIGYAQAGRAIVIDLDRRMKRGDGGVGRRGSMGSHRSHAQGKGCDHGAAGGSGGKEAGAAERMVLNMVWFPLLVLSELFEAAMPEY